MVGRISHLLNRSPSIKRDTSTSDGQGGFTTTLTEVATPKGRRHAARGTDRFVAGREDVDVTHVWYFDFGVDIKIQDTIEDGGAKYEVLALLPPSLDEFLKVQAQEIQSGS